MSRHADFDQARTEKAPMLSTCDWHSVLSMATYGADDCYCIVSH